MPAVCAAVGCFNSSSKWSVLCSAHFTADAYEDKVRLMKNMGMDYKPRLKQDAVPTIFSHKRRQPQRTPGAFAKRRRMEIVSELLSSPAGPSTSCSVALRIQAEPLTEAIICTEPVAVGAAEGDCPDASAPLDFSVPRVNSDTSKPSKRDKSVQVLVRPRTKSARTQARAPARSIGAQTFFPCTDAACQTSQWRPKEADPGESCDELGEPDREDPGAKDDKDYIPSEEYRESFAEPRPAPDNNRVFLVAEVQFRQLFKVCPKCYASCQVSIECEGTVVEVISKCPVDHHSYWVNRMGSTSSLSSTCCCVQGSCLQGATPQPLSEHCQVLACKWSARRHSSTCSEITSSQLLTQRGAKNKQHCWTRQRTVP
ncbi:uncharacterized protein LOC121833452 [Ixodes scapularis]|uniref:uncharacterized protein LOC121833452 n=1 Tax=Ixodes scapularis TaxID=6945 RepID=UPI001C3927CC|nr:uncharacterized protein LOC121833452 [Ixodes scapularis]